MRLSRIYTISQLRDRMHRRIPRIARDYAETGTGDEVLLERNRSQFNDLYYVPKFCRGKIHTDCSLEVLGERYDFPFGISPMGMAGLVWPGADEALARVALESNIPFVLSTVSSSSPEVILKKSDIGPKNLWFQLYYPKNNEILFDLLHRVNSLGIDKLVVTVDIPAPSIRERSKISGVNLPLKFTPKLIIDAVLHPMWSIAILKNGIPKFKTLEKYSSNKSMKFVSNFAGNRLGGTISWETLVELKSTWSGKIILKGILSPEDALKAKKIGIDGIIVSNHGGRQFDGGIRPLDSLPQIREVVGESYPIFYDSGIRSGLDVLKALSLGANFVFIGRPFLYGMGSYGYLGVKKVIEIISNQVKNNLMQLGVPNIGSLKSDYSIFRTH